MPKTKQDFAVALARNLKSRFTEVADLDSTHVWTSAVYQALAIDCRTEFAELVGCTAQDLNAPIEPRSGAGGVDFSWVKKGHPEKLLVAESEWGKQRSSGGNRVEVVRDLQKLVDSNAPWRVMVYGFHAETVDALDRELQTMAESSLTPATFVFVGVSWQGGPVETLRAWTVKSNRAGGPWVRRNLPTE